MTDDQDGPRRRDTKTVVSGPMQLVVAIVMAACLLAVFALFAVHNLGKEEQRVDAEADTVIAVGQIAEQFDSNIVRFRHDHLGTVLETTGPIDNIRVWKAHEAVMTIVLHARGTDIGTLTCVMESDEQLLGYVKEDVVTVRGLVTGTHVGGVTLEECIVPDDKAGP